MTTLFHCLFFFLISCILIKAPEPERFNITELHIVLSNHLDVGFTDYIVNVINEYFDPYFQKINQIGIEAEFLNISFTYTTQPWLISLFMECPSNSGLNCPDNDAKKLFLDSIKRGNLVWHSFPFNSQNEVYDKSLFEYGLWLSTKYLPSIISETQLIPHVISQRDVPGMTRSLIPLLVEYNISAISIGCNGLSAPPDVPNIFKWYDPISNTSIITMLHPGGYGGELPRDVVMINNYTEAIMFAWNGDNRGPFEIETFLSGLEAIKEEFPNAYVHASTFDAFINNLLNNPSIVASLPVIDAEIGDTWSYGPSSDPLKLSLYRAAARHRSNCIINGKCILNIHSESESVGGMSPFNNFSRYLLKCGEHTFGMSISKYLTQSYDNWSNQQLNNGLNKHNIDLEMILNSWYEQRKWCIQFAMDALKLSNNTHDIQLYNNITNEFDIISNPLDSLPNLTDSTKWIQITNNSIMNISQIFPIIINNNSEYLIQFNSTTGALKKFENVLTGVDYIGDISNDIDFIHGFGLFYYTTRTEQDFIDFYVYNYSWHGVQKGCQKGYCKEGLNASTNGQVQHQNIQSSLIGLYKHINKDIFVVKMDLGEKQIELNEYYGAPQIVYNIINFTEIINNNNNNKYGNNAFSMKLIWKNKTFTRIPENLWFIFNPSLKCNKMLVNKIGEMVDIQNVVKNGTFHLHGVSPDGIVECQFNNNNNMIKVQPIDAGLSGFVPEGYNEFTSFPTPLDVKSNLNRGFGFMLFNNVWDTNYPQWYPFDNNDMNAIYRFNIYLS